MPKLSTGLRNHLLATGSIKAALDGGVIRIYSGTEPATADAAIGSAQLLVTISKDGTGAGLTLATSATNGIITKNTTEVWRGSVSATGTASFFRFSAISDTGGASSTEKRLQGTVGTMLADLLVSNDTFTSGSSRQIEVFNIALPSE